MNKPGSGNGKQSLRIAINAQMRRGKTGGIETAVTELIHALGKLSEVTGDDDEYLILGPGEDMEWLRPFLAGNQRLLRGAEPSFKTQGRFALLKRVSEPLRSALRSVRHALPFSHRLGANPLEAAGGSAFFDSLGCDVVHFPYQTFAPCQAPTVYNPHDLQHLHFPQFFQADEIRRREAMYRLACRLSETVIVGSHWVAQDVAAKYQLPIGKIQIIQWAPPIHGEPDLSDATLAAVKQKYHLIAPFALYPAATFEHKNHLRLMQAVKCLRARGESTIDVVCTGQQTPHYRRIETELRVLGLQDTVRFLGRVPRGELRALYRLARFVFLPTLFEAASAPLFEAWRDAVPVACANVTSLPEQAADAALLFDPFSIEGIANAFHRMQTDEELRRVLLTNGQRRLRAFSWERTAKAYRAVYRRAAGRHLSDEERHLLDRR